MGDASGEALLLRGDPPELPRLLATQAEGFLRRHLHADRNLAVHPGGSADLILVFLPALLLLGGDDNNHRWHCRLTARDVLGAAATVLRPGGYLVTVTGSGELEETRSDLGAETVSLCTELGLSYWQHIVALLAPIAGGQLTPARRTQHRHGSALAPSRVVHRDVYVFRKPAANADQRRDALEERRAA
jgi:hypothetical protein